MSFSHPVPFRHSLLESEAVWASGSAHHQEKITDLRYGDNYQQRLSTSKPLVLLQQSSSSSSLYSNPAQHANTLEGMDALSSSWSTLPFPQFNPAAHANSNPMFNFNSNVGASLDVLSAESYDFVDNAKSRNKKPQVDEGRTLPFGVTGDSRGPSATSKRHKVSSEEAEPEGRRKKKARVEPLSEEDEAAKKARGRPRLDTKDETAIDRRRTQIRNAQRAYRSRKETTISSLETKVQELMGNNEEMSNMFMNLYEFAVGKGLLEREPEFAAQLTSTTERFLSLATKVSAAEESSKDDEPIDENRGKLSRSKSEQQQPSSSPEVVQPPIAPSASPPPPPVVNSYGGYQISYDTTSGSDDLQSPQQDAFVSEQNVSDLQIIAHATPDNASFFDMTNMQQYHAEVPAMETFSQYLPQEFLPLPASYAYTELSFARRMHRQASEGGYKLICSANPNPKRFKDVFSFTLRYDTKETIKARLKKAVFSSAKDDLQDWKAPFLHLGGAGTHYPMDESDKGDMPTFHTSGLSMGPFREAVTSTGDNFLEDDMQTFCSSAEFEGQFFDPYDVDKYLQSRGIHIIDNMQYVSVNLESLIPYPSSEVQSSTTNSAQTFSPRTPLSTIQDAQFTGMPDFFGVDDAFNTEDATNMFLSNPIGDSTLTTSDFADWDTEQYQVSSPTKVQDSFNQTIAPIFNSMPVVQQAEEGPSPLLNSRLHKVISIKVDTLLMNLAPNVVCLGRAPGIKPEFVDSAIWAAVREAVLV